MDIKEDFWIKKIVRNIEKNIAKDKESETLTATLADDRGTTISIKGDPNILRWLESERKVSVHVTSKLVQTSLDEKAPARKGESEVEVRDEGWDERST